MRPSPRTFDGIHNTRCQNERRLSLPLLSRYLSLTTTVHIQLTLILGGYQPPPLQQAPPHPHSHQQYVQEYDPSGFYPHHQQPPPRHHHHHPTQQQQQQQQQHPQTHHQGPPSPLVQTRTHHPQAPAPAPQAPQYPDSSSVAGGGPPYAVEYAPAPPPLQHSEYIPAPPPPEHAGGQTADGEALDEEPLYVNAKQYHRILKRRSARQRLEEVHRLSRQRKVSERSVLDSHT